MTTDIEEREARAEGLRKAVEAMAAFAEALKRLKANRVM